MPNDEDFTKLSNVVPEFWHDLIARIIPGFVILATSFPSLLQAASATIGGFVGIVLLAYVLGIIADILFDGFLRLAPPYDRHRNRIYSQLNGATNERPLIVKMLAEIVLFRTMFLLSLVHSVISAIICYDPNLATTFFQGMKTYPWWLAIPASAAMLLSWIRMNKNTSLRFPDNGNNNPMDRSGGSAAS